MEKIMAKEKGRVVMLHPTGKGSFTTIPNEKQSGLAVIQKQYNERLTQALTYKATNAESYTTGGTLLSVFSEATKRAKEEKAKTLDPAELTVKRIKEQWKPFEDALKECVQHIKNEMDAFRKKESERIEKEVKRIAADKRMKPETKVSKLMNVSLPDLGNTRAILKLVIDNVNLIPREYLVPDEVKIKAALREGAVIPGARLERESITVTK